jgi:hypothetical protein
VKRSIGDCAANGDSYKPIVTSPAAKGRLRQGFLLGQHFSELVDGSGIAPDLAALNAASWGPGTNRHWESERSELTRFARRKIQTESVTGSGHQQNQPGHLAARLIHLDQRYRHFEQGGWRSLSAALPGLEAFDQWKPDQPRQRHDKPGRSIKYEAPPQCPDGGGLLLPRIPDKYWELICQRHGLPFPADRSMGFWPWALATPELPLLIVEGFKKALAAVSAGYAAIGLPGVSMGRRRTADDGERLIDGLALLACEKRRWLIAFDAEAKPSTAVKVGAAAGALARCLRATGGNPSVCRLPLLPGTDKTGLDDFWVAGGSDALDAALADTGPQPVLPSLRRADRLAPAGQWLGEAQPIPSPAEAPLVLLQAPMGCGKTEAIRTAAAPFLDDGTPLLIASHRKALGQALAERLGVAWMPRRGSDERLQGAGFCFDSCCPNSSLRIDGHSWSGGALVLDEWMQAVEHLLLSSGTALGQNRRAEVLRTLAELLPRQAQTIAADAQLAQWGVDLLERLTGRKALLIRSDHQPMKGRALHCPSGLKTAKDAGKAFRAKWAELVRAGQPFLCWTSAQQAGMTNAPATLAAGHRQQRPEARVLVIDSTTPEAAAELAADPDGVAQQYDAIYCSPAISSGVSFERWKPAAVIACAGGQIAPEHIVQAAARVRCPEVPVFLFAPERCPGAALRVGSGATDRQQLIDDLKAVSDPLFGELDGAGANGVWLDAWAELGMIRNRQRFAYRATIAGLLEREGWELDGSPMSASMDEELAAALLKPIAEEQLKAQDHVLLEAPAVSPEAAAVLAAKQRLSPTDQLALKRFQLAERWALPADAAVPLELLEADRDSMREQLKTAYLLATPEAWALVPDCDAAKITALDPTEQQPFAPDRLRVTLGAKLMALRVLGLPALLKRLGQGETICATDPAVLRLHATATAHKRQLIAATGISPGKKASGTLRALLNACGWTLKSNGRVNSRGADRGAYLYKAAPMPVPDGVDKTQLQAGFLAELKATSAGAKNVPIENPIGTKKAPPIPPPPHRSRGFAPKPTRRTATPLKTAANCTQNRVQSPPLWAQLGLFRR